MDIVIIGIDLGKYSCSLAGMDASGRVVLKWRMRRSSLERFTKGLRCPASAPMRQFKRVEEWRISGSS